MKTTVRLLSMLLAIVLLASCFVACNGDPSSSGNEGSSGKQTNPVAGTNPDEGSDGSLQVIDWGGELYTILGRDGGAQSQFTSFEVGYDELPVDVVGQAVYKRNQDIKNKYNFKVVQQLVTEPSTTAQIAYESGDDLYDLVIYRPSVVQAHAQSGYLLNLAELDHVNLEHESWYQDVNEELTIGDKLYYTTNDFLLQDKHRFWYCFYNRGLAQDLNLGYFEDMVDNNEWTMENVTKIVKQGYADIDTTVGRSNGDRYGLAYQEYFTFTVFAFSSGFRLTEKDNNNYPQLVGATDKAINTLESVFGLIDNNGTWCQQSDGSFDNDDSHPEVMFKRGQVVLLQAFTSFIDFFLMDETGIAYGALPNPKYDKDQENYYVFPNVGNGSFLAVPYTVGDEEFAGYALEAITEESTDTSYTAYIDTKCKYQDAYDKDCARMLDLCFSSCTYDIGSFCNFGGLYASLHSGGNGNGGLAGLGGANFYKRYFDTYKKAAQADIDELIDSYN